MQPATFRFLFVKKKKKIKKFFVNIIFLSASGREVRENHKDYNQVVLDVRRSMKRFPKGAFMCVCYLH